MKRLHEYTFYILLLCAWPAAAQNNAAETAAGTETSLFKPATGEITWLQAGDQRLMAIFTEEAAGSRQGGIIIISDAGMHPDWPAVVQPLRTGLPDYGWATLSVANPLTLNDLINAPVEEAIKRLRDVLGSAVDEMTRRGLGNLIVVAYGMSATPVMAAIGEPSPLNGVKAFVGISLGTQYNMAKNLAPEDYITRNPVPMLDIYGSNDDPLVVDNAARRFAAGRKLNLAHNQLSANPGLLGTGYFFRQIEIPGANHSFSGSESSLTKRIIGWLRRSSTTLFKSTASLQENQEQ